MKNKKRLKKSNNKESSSEAKKQVKQIQKKAIVFAILTIIILSILTAYTYYNSRLARSKDRIIAVVNGEKIKISELEEIMAWSLNYGIETNKSQALENLITSKIIIQEAKKNGYIRPREEVEKEMQEQLALQGINIEDMKKELEKYNISYEKYIDEYVKISGSRDYLLSRLKEKEIKITEEEALKFYENNKEILGIKKEFSEIKEDMIDYLKKQKEDEHIMQLIKELRDKAKVEYKINLLELQ